MTAITSTAQLSIFTLIRDAIIANSTLFEKFDTSNIFQFEPKHKSAGFRGFPYIWIEIPETETDKIVFDNNLTLKNFTLTVHLRMDYEARDNFLNYANAVIKAIEDYESTFQSSGYYDVMVEMTDVDSNQVIHSKELVEGLFEVRNHGKVFR